MTPAEVDECSLFAFVSALDGWQAAHGAEEQPAAPSAEEFHDMVARLG